MSVPEIEYYPFKGTKHLKKSSTNLYQYIFVSVKNRTFYKDVALSSSCYHLYTCKLSLRK